MTNCPTEDVLLDYIAGSLDAGQAALFERHAGTCARCTALRAGQAEVWRSLDQWKPEPVSVDFNRELWRRIDAEAGTPPWRGWLGSLHAGLWKQVAPLVVAMALVVTAYMLDHRPGPAAATGNSSVMVTSSEADQLERTLEDIQLLDAANSVSPASKPASELM